MISLLSNYEKDTEKIDEIAEINEESSSTADSQDDDDPFNKIIKELKEDLAQELANTATNSSFEFIDNED